MLDFTKLRSETGGLRSAFEGLVCQLGRRHPPDGAARFVSIDGSGGDGGIESYWIKTDGSELGYQAKFHLRSGEIDWEKIDKSVSAALASHPRMTEMVVAIACDLTANVPGRKGKSGSEHWDSHLQTWLKLAARDGRSVSFRLWDASTIEDLLTDTKSVGLRSYWLDEIELTTAWFRDTFLKANTALEEKYNPDDHVEIRAELAFGALLSDRRFDDAVQDHIGDISSTKLPKDSHVSPTMIDRVSAVNELVAAIENLPRVVVCAGPSFFPYPDHLAKCGELEKAARAFLYNCDRAVRILDDEIDSRVTVNAYRKLKDTAEQLLEASSQYVRFLTCDLSKAEQEKIVVIRGSAGSGKSHLLGSEIDRATSAGKPAILMIGNHFNESRTIAEQIPGILGLGVNLQTFLAALNAAGEASNTRALIAVDAINEGGRRRWYSELPSLLHTIKSYPWLAIAVSCRSEYLEYLISENTLSKAAVVELEGFTTEEEQEKAAQIYLDRRGILRPVAPWLSPEFSNPLFLRTTAIALQTEGLIEYPRGLQGTKKVLSFFLRVAGRHLGTDFDGSDTLVRPLAVAVKAIAEKMARSRLDYITLEEAQELAERSFVGFLCPSHNWLEVLRLRGLVRLDPPLEQSDDPLLAANDIVRFSFQRFQDHLVAEALLDLKTPTKQDFETGGQYAFLLRSVSGWHRQVEYEWVGVFQALWLGHAERNSRELVDDLPDDAKLAFDNDIFAETIYWRSSDAFTARTWELFEKWFVKSSEDNHHQDTRILLRLCVLEHPWNAQFLHRNLAVLPLVDRDRSWTRSLNAITQSGWDGSEVERLVRWCESDATSAAADQVLERALTTLAWLFTTTNKSVRDRATKAAVSILIRRPSLSSTLLTKLAGANDPYVVERVAAACAGACLRDPSTARLREVSSAVYAAFFASGQPPLHVLTRDYGRLIIELSHDHGCLPPEIDLAKCRPPYRSDPPEHVDPPEVEARAKAAGADSILHSCVGIIADFGKYVIEGRAKDFSTVSLQSPAPTTNPSEQWKAKQSLAYDVEAAKYWIADRAISYGWTKALFPRDGKLHDSRIEGAKIERIGKKYQWIAYFEFISRMADNYWLVDDFSETFARLYDTPLDTSFVRNIEISLPSMTDSEVELNTKFEPPAFNLNPVNVEHQQDWVFEKGIPEARLSSAMFKFLEDPKDWVVLYIHANEFLSWPERDASTRHPFRQNEFHFQILGSVPKRKLNAMIAKAHASRTDFHDWLPETRTDDGYVYELGIRSTWTGGEVGPERGWPEKDRFKQYTVGFHWERHLDGSLPYGLELQLPSPWLSKALSLRPDPYRPGLYLSAGGRPVVVSGRNSRGSWCVGRRAELLQLVENLGHAPVWMSLGERSAWADSSERNLTRVRWNGMMRLRSGKPEFTIWDERDIAP